MNQPNFFVVGAPKCGTTSLQIYLSRHPQVFMSEPKEPHFFCSDFPLVRARGPVPTFDDYLALFGDANGALAIGEASPLYLFSQTAPAEIYRFNPQAKIIIMVRNPADAIPAFHAQWLLSMLEDEQDFETAWRLQADRAQGRRLPQFAVDAPLYQYSQLFRLAEKIDHVLSVFPADQVHVIVFDEFVRDTRAAYEDTLAFLGLPSDGQIEFPKVNANRTRRFPMISRGLYALSSWSVFAAATRLWRHKTGQQSPTTALWQLFERVTAKEAPREAISDTLRQELVETFRDDVSRLSTLLGKDLSHWSG